MNFFKICEYSRARRGLLVSLLSLSLLSCGSEVVVLSGITGTGIVVGTVTAFGSIWVNGVEYDIDTADFDVNGTALTGVEGQQQLQIGMVVRLDATDNGDGTGVATNVIYDEAIQGPVLDVPSIPASGDIHKKEMTVLGQTVVIDETGTSFIGTNFTTIKQNDIVEVSGYVDQSGNILATLVKLKGTYNPEQGVAVEMHGVISNLTATDFSMNGVTIGYNANTQLEDMNALENGLLVEVKGQYQADGSVLAETIEGEDDDRETIESSSGDISLQGLVSGLDTANSRFQLNGITVDYSTIASTLAASLADGLEVEVEGEMTDGILHITKLELRQGETKLKARVASVDVTANSLNIGFNGVNGELVIVIDNTSLLEDERDGYDQVLTLAEIEADLQNSVPVEIEAELIQNGSQLVVDKLKRKQLEDYEIQGLVSAVDKASSTMTMLELDITMSSSAEYEMNDSSVGFDQFFDAIIAGETRVKLKDNNADGSFDQAEIESEDD